MLSQKNFSHAVGVAAFSALLGLPAAYAQNGTVRDANEGMDQRADRMAMDNARSTVVEDDREFMNDIAEANLAEIATAKMALEKSDDPQVRRFAQIMIDDHTKAENELKLMADSKGVNLTNDTDLKHKAKQAMLMPLTGDLFDTKYMEHGGVGDHQSAHELLSKVQRNAKDADLKAYAGKTIKVVDEHLRMAKSIVKKENR